MVSVFPNLDKKNLGENFFNGDIIFLRISLIENLIGLFELPEDTSVPDDEHFIDVEDTPGTVILF
jgi:hypothetical protein